MLLHYLRTVNKGKKKLYIVLGKLGNGRFVHLYLKNSKTVVFLLPKLNFIFQIIKLSR